MKLIFLFGVLLGVLANAAGPEATCNDFTGKWKGTCKSQLSGSIQKTSIYLVMDSACENISIAGVEPLLSLPSEVLSFHGRVRTVTYENGYYFSQVKTRSSFLDDFKTSFQSEMSTREVDIETGQILSEYKAKGTYELQDTSILDLKRLDFYIGTVVEHCIFEK